MVQYYMVEYYMVQYYIMVYHTIYYYTSSIKDGIRYAIFPIFFMLVQSINQLELAVNETNEILDNIYKDLNVKTSQLPCGLNPISIKKRIGQAKQRADSQIQLKNSLEEQKRLVCIEASKIMEKNKELLQELLSFTEYSGDYVILDQFQELVSLV